MSEILNDTEILIAEEQAPVIESQETFLEEEMAAVEPEAPEVTEVPAIEPIQVHGKVIECTRLNVRELPDLKATVVTVLTKGAEVLVDVSDERDQWYRICTASGLEGYCMKEYISVIE